MKGGEVRYHRLGWRLLTNGSLTPTEGQSLCLKRKSLGHSGLSGCLWEGFVVGSMFTVAASDGYRTVGTMASFQSRTPAKKQFRLSFRLVIDDGERSSIRLSLEQSLIRDSSRCLVRYTWSDYMITTLQLSQTGNISTFYAQ